MIFSVTLVWGRGGGDLIWVQDKITLGSKTELYFGQGPNHIRFWDQIPYWVQDGSDFGF